MQGYKQSVKTEQDLVNKYRAEHPFNPYTGTDKFKKWFGDSGVVDAEGNPKVMYRGLNNDYGGTMRPNRLGLIFTTDGTATANSFSGAVAPTGIEEISAMFTG